MKWNWCFIFLLTLLIYIDGYTQRSTMNKEDRLFLMKNLFQLMKPLGWDSIHNVGYDEKNIFLLTDVLPLGIKTIDTTEKSINKAFENTILQVAGTIYCLFLKEFPQFKKIKFCINSKCKIYTVNNEKIEYYNDVKKSKQSLKLICQ